MVILEKILNDLKAKLPFLNKGKQAEELDEYEEDEDASHDDATDSTDLADLQRQVDEDEEFEEEEEVDEAPVSIVDKIKHKLKSLQKSSSKGKEESEEDVDEVAALKKKRSKIIQIVIGVAVVLFLLSDFNEEEGTAPVESPEEYSGEVPEKTPPKTETPKTETPVETPAETPAETPVATEEPVVTPPVTTEELTETPPSDGTVAISTEEPIADISNGETPDSTDSGEVISLGDDLPDSEPTVPTESPDDSSSIPFEFGEDSVGEDMGTVGDENLTDQILLDLEKQSKSAPISEPKTEYVAPPDYEYRGRGLVYNCVGKHWACVDGPSYKTCEDNASSVQYLKKKVECHPFNVYETTKGCESMQNRMVSSSAKTSFCSE